MTWSNGARRCLKVGVCEKVRRLSNGTRNELSGRISRNKSVLGCPAAAEYEIEPTDFFVVRHKPEEA